MKTLLQLPKRLQQGLLGSVENGKTRSYLASLRTLLTSKVWWSFFAQRKNNRLSSTALCQSPAHWAARTECQ